MENDEHCNFWGGPVQPDKPQSFSKIKIKKQKTKDYPLVNQHSNGKPPFSIGFKWWISHCYVSLPERTHPKKLMSPQQCWIFAEFAFSGLDIQAYRMWGSRVHEAPNKIRIDSSSQQTSQVPGRFASTFLVGFLVRWIWFNLGLIPGCRRHEIYLSHEKKSSQCSLNYIGCLIGILIMVYEIIPVELGSFSSPTLNNHKTLF